MKKKGTYCTNQTFIHVRCQVKLWTRKKIHTGNLEYQLIFSSLKRRPPRDISYTLILGLAHFFDVVPSEESHPPELHQNHQIQDANVHPNLPPLILESLSYTQMLSISTFLHQLINHSNLRLILKIPHIIYIMVCFLSLNISSKIHTATLWSGNPPKKWISDFQALRVAALLLNYSNFSTKCCNLLQHQSLSLPFI